MVMREDRTGDDAAPRTVVVVATALANARRLLFVLTLAFGLIGCASRGTISGTTAAQWLPRHPDTDLRVLVWNVDREFFNRNPGFQRVLRAADADLLILDEMPAGASDAQLVAALPATATPWSSLYGSGGGLNQRASISVRAPIERVGLFDRLPYPRARFEEWMAEIPERKRERVRDSLDAGVAAVGGVVTWRSRRLLVVGLDLECCGDDDDSPAEHRRRFEARAIRAAIDDVVDGLDVDAILVGGDFNTVHGEAAVRILERGPDAATTLAHPTPLHRRSADLDWTWDGRGTPFPSRRIDYLLHSERLTVLQSQVFDSEDLDADEQARLGLEAALSTSLSPHRPIVIDLGWRD
jgi:endonuclease/exonuclease/phosphatase (EEP) superfamily protein YafD